MPKKEDIPPTTEDKIYETRKSLPLYKKIQYFVQANRGWVGKTMVLSVVAVGVLSLIVMQDKILNNVHTMLSVTKKQSTLSNYRGQNNQIAFKDTVFFSFILNKNSYDKKLFANAHAATVVKVLDRNNAVYMIKMQGRQENVSIKIDQHTTLYLPKYSYDSRNNINGFQAEAVKSRDIASTIENGSCLIVDQTPDGALNSILFCD